jgi:hypothetical protein
MTSLAVGFATLFVVALALLIIAISCLDELTDETRALKREAARRILELEAEKKAAQSWLN